MEDKKQLLAFISESEETAKKEEEIRQERIQEENLFISQSIANEAYKVLI